MPSFNFVQLARSLGMLVLLFLVTSLTPVTLAAALPPSFYMERNRHSFDNTVNTTVNSISSIGAHANFTDLTNVKTDTDSAGATIYTDEGPVSVTPANKSWNDSKDLSVWFCDYTMTCQPSWSIKGQPWDKPVDEQQSVSDDEISTLNRRGAAKYIPTKGSTTVSINDNMGLGTIFGPIHGGPIMELPRSREKNGAKKYQGQTDRPSEKRECQGSGKLIKDMNTGGSIRNPTSSNSRTC